MKRVLFFSVFLFCVLSVSAVANPGDTLWTHTYGGTNYDEARSVRQTSDGGYILAGVTESFGSYYQDFYLVKTDPFGDTLWSRLYNLGFSDIASEVSPTDDGGYVIAGVGGLGGNTRFIILKVDSIGVGQWIYTYDGNYYEWAFSAQQTNDGGYIGAGYTSSIGAGYNDFYLVKTDAFASVEWTHTYGGSNDDWAYCVRQTSDGGFVACGYTMSYGAGAMDFYLVRTDSLGDTLWTHTYGGVASEEAYSVQETSDGGFIIAGYTSSFGGPYKNFYLVKTDASGDTLWTRAYGGTYDEVARSIRQTSDNGFIIAGYTHTYHPPSSYNFYLIKTNSLGDTLWTHTYGGNSVDEAYALDLTSDNGYVLTGKTYSFGAGGYDAYLVKVEGDIPPCSDVSMVPDNFPVNVPPGGAFGLTGTIANPTANPVVTDIWVGVIFQNIFFQIWNFPNIPLNAGQQISAHLNQQVPVFAPPGIYDYVAYCGDNPVACDSAKFQFTVTGARISGGFDSWTLAGNWGNKIETPNKLGLIENSPNPFNASTTIEYQLPINCNVKLEIFNLLGQKVATLVNGYNEAGQHSITWDAANYSSGIYFYKLIAGENVFVKRMTLLK